MPRIIVRTFVVMVLVAQSARGDKCASTFMTDEEWQRAEDEQDARISKCTPGPSSAPCRVLDVQRAAGIDRAAIPANSTIVTVMGAHPVIAILSEGTVTGLVLDGHRWAPGCVTKRVETRLATVTAQRLSDEIIRVLQEPGQVELRRRDDDEAAAHNEIILREVSARPSCVLEQRTTAGTQVRAADDPRPELKPFYDLCRHLVAASGLRDDATSKSVGRLPR